MICSLCDWHSCWRDSMCLLTIVCMCFFEEGLQFLRGWHCCRKGTYSCVPVCLCVCVFSMTVSGWRRRPWSLHRWGWCTAGSGGSAGGNRARWPSGESGPGLLESGQDGKHTRLLSRQRYKETLPPLALWTFGWVSSRQTKVPSF